MLKYEEITMNNKQFCKHYSDEEKYIRQIETGVLYSEAVDIMPCKYTYEETDEKIENLKENELKQGTKE